MSDFDVVTALLGLLICAIGFLFGVMFSAISALNKSRHGELSTHLLSKMGDCDTCGEWSGSVEEGQCAMCRRRIPA